ncbi:MAG: polyprenyl synthetase family protein [Minisyncoccales bacterium]
MPKEKLDFLKKEGRLIDKIVLKFFPKKPSKRWINLLLKKTSFTLSFKALKKAIHEPVWNFLERGGKRWRPVFFINFFEALGGERKKVILLAPLFELVHEGTLIIDDIEDNAVLRRGKMALHKIFGQDIAINAGNFLYFFPYLFFRLVKNNFDKETENKFWEIYFQEMINLHLGQATDIFWHKNKISNISPSEYFQMCAFKTGCLLRMICKMAGLLKGKDEKIIERLGRFGEKVGIAFQIQDDILDISLEGKERKAFGKDFGNDIKEGKKTLMVIFALQKANKRDKKRLLEILAKGTDSFKEKKEAIEIIKKYGAITFAEKKAKELLKKAWREVEPFLIKQRAKERIKDFIYFLIERKI